MDAKSAKEIRKLYQDAGLSETEINTIMGEEIYDTIYMDVVKLVENDNIQCEEYRETAKKLMEKYVIKLRK
jgi:hypothetical protein